MNLKLKCSAAALLTNAAMLVGGDRARTHGDKAQNHAKIGVMWNALLHIRPDPAAPLDAHDVATMMELLKIARRYSGSFNPDDYLDGAGYAAVAYEIKGNEEALMEQLLRAPPEDDGA